MACCRKLRSPVASHRDSQYSPHESQFLAWQGLSWAAPQKAGWASRPRYASKVPFKRNTSLHSARLKRSRLALFARFSPHLHCSCVDDATAAEEEEEEEEAVAEEKAAGPEADKGKLVAAKGGRSRRLSSKASSVLVVGGSDGSGTRSVVALLEKLGVYMVVDDRGTNDVHGAEMGGWPPVVSPVLSAANGKGDYELEALPRNVREGTLNQMGRFVESMRKQGTAGSQRLEKHADALLAKSSLHAAKVASGVAYGYKAPVSMLLVPFLHHLYRDQGFKFLQVVRDGRDIAFSGNQSPVNKFYRNTFSDKEYDKWGSLPEVRAMQLWSGWNSDVNAWGSRRNLEKDETFEHLTIHTEDLIDPSTKFETVRQVAGFVGAEALSNDELCCMVVQPEEFMGSHAKEIGNRGRGEVGAKAEDRLSKRFGHWHAKLDGKPELSAALHKEGARGLRMFGYEPEKAARHPPPLDGYVCSLTPDECSTRGLSPPKGAPSENKGGARQPAPRGHKEAGSSAVPPDGARCSFEALGTDFKGKRSGDLVAVDAPDASSCCADCAAHQGCGFFTYDPSQALCYLKKGKGDVVVADNGLISGRAIS